MAAYGWQILFWIGGFVPLLAALLVFFTLPESIKYLSLRPERSGDLADILGRLQPGLVVDRNARFVIGGEDNRGSFSWTAIFKGRLAWITPLFWISNAINLMIFYFVNQWIPTILSTNGVSVAHAALAITAFQFAGTIGGLVIMRPLDKFGFVPVPILFACAIPIVACIGLPGMSEGLTIALVAASGFCLLGLQFGNIASETNMYPTYIRSWGVGSCFGAGRVGSVIGPYVGGWLIQMNLPRQELFFIAAIPLVLGRPRQRPRPDAALSRRMVGTGGAAAATGRRRRLRREPVRAMRRRDVVALLAGAALARPSRARASRPARR